MIGIWYALVIVLASAVGAVSGMGGGVLIKPIFDTIGAHPITQIGFFSSVAVFVMSIVSTWRQVKSGNRIKTGILLPIAGGAILGGLVGNGVFNWFVSWFSTPGQVTLIQIILTLLTLIFALWASKNPDLSFDLNSFIYYILCGFILGFLASFLGIGGGPINVSLLMLMFAFPIKQATVYSIGIIFFSQLAKLLSIALSGAYLTFDLPILWYVVPAAIVGGLLGAKLSNILSQKQVQVLFQVIILVVMLINIYNAWRLVIL